MTKSCPYPEGEGGSPGLQFWVPDFMVGTSDAFIVGMESQCFGEVRPEDRRGTLLMQGFADDVTGVTCHPSRSLLALACHAGSLQVWDYELKLLMNLREFNSHVEVSPFCIAPCVPLCLSMCVSFHLLGHFWLIPHSRPTHSAPPIPCDVV